MARPSLCDRTAMMHRKQTGHAGSPKRWKLFLRNYIQYPISRQDLTQKNRFHLRASAHGVAPLAVLEKYWMCRNITDFGLRDVTFWRSRSARHALYRSQRSVVADTRFWAYEKPVSFDFLRQDGSKMRMAYRTPRLERMPSGSVAPGNS
jgi:hypothetical protein